MRTVLKLARKWEKIADRLGNKPVTMTANTHRLFANELRVAIAADLPIPYRLTPAGKAHLEGKAK